MNDSRISWIAYILPIIVLVWVGTWAIYRGIIAIKHREFIFPLLPYGGFLWFSDIHGKGYPAVKGWIGVLIGVIFILVGFLALSVSLYILPQIQSLK